MNTLMEMPCSMGSVVLVEDHDDTACFVRRLLERDGYSVIHVADGGQAHHLITTTEPPELVLLDITLPIFTGLELLRVIRTTPEWQWLPVILLTADSRAETMAAAADLGATQYMEKHFIVNHLLKSVRTFLARPDVYQRFELGNPH